MRFIETDLERKVCAFYLLSKWESGRIFAPLRLALPLLL